MPMNDEVRKALKELDAAHDQRFAPWRNQWQAVRDELTRLTEIAEGVDPLVIRLGEVTTRLEAASALLHRTRTTHYDAAERIRLDADIEAHLSENGHD